MIAGDKRKWYGKKLDRIAVLTLTMRHEAKSTSLAMTEALDAICKDIEKAQAAISTVQEGG